MPKSNLIARAGYALAIAAATLSLTGCPDNSKVPVRVPIGNSVERYEGKNGLEMVVRDPEGTVIEYHFPLIDGMAHLFWRPDGTLESARDESVLGQGPRSQASFDEKGTTVTSGRLNNSEGNVLLLRYLTPEGEHGTDYTIATDLAAQTRSTAGGDIRWTWNADGKPGGAPWFSVTYDAGRLLRRSLEFYARPDQPVTASPIRQCSVGSVLYKDDEESIIVTFYKKDGESEDFRQYYTRYRVPGRWTHRGRMPDAYTAWGLTRVEQLHTDGQVERALITLQERPDKVVLYRAIDWPGTDRQAIRNYSVFGGPAARATTVETWQEDGVTIERKLFCQATPNSPADGTWPATSEANLDPRYFFRFRLDVCNQAFARLRSAVTAAATQSPVPELRWYEFELPTPIP